MSYERPSKEPNGYYIDVQASEDKNTVTVKLWAGPILGPAYTMYTTLAATNLVGTNIEYIRFRIVADATEIVLSRKTPTGTGDW